MTLYKRLERLESETQRAVPQFHTLEAHQLNDLHFFGVEGGKEFHRQECETEPEFRQRCERFAIKHSHKGFMPLCFQIEMRGCSIFNRVLTLISTCSLETGV